MNNDDMLRFLEIDADFNDLAHCVRSGQRNDSLFLTSFWETYHNTPWFARSVSPMLSYHRYQVVQVALNAGYGPPQNQEALACCILTLGSAFTRQERAQSIHQIRAWFQSKVIPNFLVGMKDDANNQDLVLVKALEASIQLNSPHLFRYLMRFSSIGVFESLDVMNFNTTGFLDEAILTSHGPESFEFLYNLIDDHQLNWPMAPLGNQWNRHLSLAIEYNRIHIVEFLLEKQPQIKTVVFLLSGLLYMENEDQIEKMMNLLLKLGGKMTNPNSSGLPYLTIWCQKHCISEGLHEKKMKIIGFFLDNGVDIEEDNGFTSPLRMAVILGQINTVEFLLNRGANPNNGDQSARKKISHRKQMPLMLAAKNDDVETFNLLLKSGACLNSKLWKEAGPKIRSELEKKLLQKSTKTNESKSEMHRL